jgi:protein CrcB
MKDLLLIGLGSCLGGMARHLVGLGVRHLGVASLWGTLAVNLLGCLLIGLLAGLFARHPNVSLAVQRFLTIGVCGGFTTFSTFSRDGLTLWQEGRLPAFALYVGGSVVAGLVAVAAGYRLAGGHA